MPENQNTENRRQRTTRAMGNAVVGGSRAVADLATLGGHVRRYNIDNSFTEFDKIPESRRRYVTRIMMNANLKSIGPDFANGATHLREVRFTPDPDRDRLNPDDPIGEKEVSLITVIPTNAFSGCIHLNVVDWESLVSLARIEAGAFSNTAIREVALLPNLTYIGEGAFNECSKLRHVYLSDDVKYIGPNAFAGCTRLVNNDKAIFGGRGVFELPKNLEFLGEGAFAGCKRIKKVKFPESIREVSGNPFLNASCYKENDKLKLTARWRLWRTQIEIPGIERHPIRAKELKKIETSLDGLRHVQLNEEHYIETEPGKFTQVSAENYEKWLKSRNDQLQAFQVTPEAFREYCMATWGKEIDIENIPQWKLDAWLNGVALDDEISITFGVGDSVTISPEKLKKAIYEMQKNRESVKEEPNPKPTEAEEERVSESTGPAPEAIVEEPTVPTPETPEVVIEDTGTPTVSTPEDDFDYEKYRQECASQNVPDAVLRQMVEENVDITKSEAIEKFFTDEKNQEFIQNAYNEMIAPYAEAQGDTITPEAEVEAEQGNPITLEASKLRKFILEKKLSPEYIKEKYQEGVNVYNLEELQAAVAADEAAMAAQANTATERERGM